MRKLRHGKRHSRSLRQVLSVVLLLSILAPAAPARTLRMVLDGRETLVDVTAPAPRRDSSVSTSGVILAHGFTRDRSTMTGYAAALAADGYWAIVPDLPYVMDSRDNALALRELIAALEGGAGGARLERFVLVGFSAGGLAALLAADATGVVGYVGLDPFDRPGGVGLEAARRLKTPVFLLRGPSAACNAYSIAEPWVRAFPNLVVHRQFASSSHCDFEWPTDRVCEFVCGEATPERQAEVRAFVRDSVRQAMPLGSGAGVASRPAQGQVDQVAE